MPDEKYIVVKVPSIWENTDIFTIDFRLSEGTKVSAKEAVKVKSADGLTNYCVKEDREAK